MTETDQLETEVLQDLQEQTYHRSEIPRVDYAVDQLRFFREAWKRVKGGGCSDLEALRQIESLALSECLRRAKTRWQKTRLVRERESGNALWPWLLNYRRPEEWDRWRISWEMMSAIVLGPYPSQAQLRGNHWAGLVAWFTPPPSPALPPSLLVPVRQDEGRTWYLELVVDGEVPIIVDIPRPPLGDVELRLSLLLLADRMEQPIESFFSLEWQMHPQTRMALAQALRVKAAQRLSPSECARLLSEVFIVPGFTYPTPVWFLTLDLTAEQMACLVGEALSQSGWLTRREVRQLQRYEESCGLIWTSGKDTVTADAGQLVASRLKHFRRPSRREAFEGFIRKTARRPVPGVGPHPVHEMDLRDPEDRQEFETSVPAPDVRLQALRSGLPYQPIARGRRKAIRYRYGLNVRTFSRRFSRYCRERGLPKSLEAVRAFEMTLRRASGKTFGPSR